MQGLLLVDLHYIWATWLLWSMLQKRRYVLVDGRLFCIFLGRQYSLYKSSNNKKITSDISYILQPVEVNIQWRDRLQRSKIFNVICNNKLLRLGLDQ